MLRLLLFWSLIYAVIADNQVIRTFEYAHPAYSVEAISAQRCYAEINNQLLKDHRGADRGFGFDEDGVNNCSAVARNFGLNLE